MLPFLLLPSCAEPFDHPAEERGGAVTEGGPAELLFLRDALLVRGQAGAEGRAVPGGRLVSRAWSAGDRVRLDGLEGVAPRRAECVALWSQPLGDVSRLVAMGGDSPDTALAFDPAGDRLAVGTHKGEVLVLDGWTGAVRARRSLAETMVKHVAWSLDGATLYAAEQSPDATLHALDPQTLEDRWTLRLADLVETSSPPAGEDLYGVYSLPAAFGLEVLSDGSLLVAATHSWAQDQVRRNRSQLLVVDPQGQIRARWPEAAADANLLHPRVDRAAGLVVVAVSRTADGPPPPELPIGGVQVLSLPELRPFTAVTYAPLSPWFTEAMVWEGLDVSGADDAILTGLGDGRVSVHDLRGLRRFEDLSGAPVLAGDVPIHVGIGWGLLHGGRALLATSTTRIPWGASSPELRPPSAHPNEDTVWALELDGRTAWRWSGEQSLQGLSLVPDRQELVVGAGVRETDARTDLYGALVFDLSEGGGDGAERLVTQCPTAGPVFFRHAVTADGRIAVSELPVLQPDGRVDGTWQVTVLR